MCGDECAYLELDLALNLLAAARCADAKEEIGVKGKHAESRVGRIDGRQSYLHVVGTLDKEKESFSSCTL